VPVCIITPCAHQSHWSLHRYDLAAHTQIVEIAIRDMLAQKEKDRHRKSWLLGGGAAAAAAGTGANGNEIGTVMLGGVNGDVM